MKCVTPSPTFRARFIIWSLGVAALLLVGPLLTGARAQNAPDGQAPKLSVVLERDTGAEKFALSSLQVPVRATVTDVATGQEADATYDVYVTPIDETGKLYENFPLFRKPGISKGYVGSVIVSKPGNWMFHVTINKYQPQLPGSKLQPIVTYLEADQQFQIEGQALQSAGQEKFFTDIGKPKPSWFETSILWIHSISAAGWSVIVGILALLALPAGRRFLSPGGLNLLENRFKSILRMNWWLTAVVVGTGIYNLKKSTPYTTPFSIGEARRTFQLPYGRPYFLDLGVKLAVYAVMLGALVPLIRRAKQFMGGVATPAMAGPDASISRRPPSPVDYNAFDPWSGGGKAKASPGRSGAVAGAEETSLQATGAVATRAEPPAVERASSAVRKEASVDASKPLWSTRIAVLIMVAGSGILIFCVSWLRSLHITIEGLRYFNYFQ